MVSCLCRHFDWFLKPGLCRAFPALYHVNNVSCYRPALLLAPSITSSPCQRFYSTQKMPQTYGERVLRFIGWLGGFYTKKAVLTRSARKIYEDCIDNIDYESFMKACGLPDTLHSWFLVAHLHIWLLLVRLKREGKDGSYLINQLVGFFWKDVQERMNLLGVKSKAMNEGLKELNHELRGLIVSYEEGLLTNDRILAGAIWRNWVADKSTTDPVMLSQLVKYIRSQVQAMDHTDSQVLLETGKMNILPLSIS